MSSFTYNNGYKKDIQKKMKEMVNSKPKPNNKTCDDLNQELVWTNTVIT